MTDHAHTPEVGGGSPAPSCSKVTIWGSRKAPKFSVTVADGRDQEAFGRLHHKHWSFPKPPRDYLFAMFVSEFDDGSFLVSTAGKKDLFPVPPNVVVQRLAGATATKLWAAHQSALQREMLARSPVPIRDDHDLDERIEQFQSTLRDFHVERGAFVPLPTKLPLEVPSPVLGSTADTDKLELVLSSAVVKSTLFSLLAKSQRSMAKGNPPVDHP